jgi:hypothetical protein
LVKNPDDGWVNPEKITLGRMYVAFDEKKNTRIKENILEPDDDDDGF